MGVFSGVIPISSLAQLGIRLYTSEDPQLFRFVDVLHSPLPIHISLMLIVLPVVVSSVCRFVLGVVVSVSDQRNTLKDPFIADAIAAFKGVILSKFSFVSVSEDSKHVGIIEFVSSTVAHSDSSMGTKHSSSQVAIGLTSSNGEFDGCFVGSFDGCNVGSSVIIIIISPCVGLSVGSFVGLTLTPKVGANVGFTVGAHRSVDPVFNIATSAQFQYCSGKPSPVGGNGFGHSLIRSSNTSPQLSGKS